MSSKYTPTGQEVEEGPGVPTAQMSENVLVEQRAEFDNLFDRMAKELVPETSLELLKKQFDLPEELARPETVLLELCQRGFFRAESVERVRRVLVRDYASAPWFHLLRQYQLKWIREEHPFQPDVVRVVSEAAATPSTTGAVEWPGVEVEFLELSQGGLKQSALYYKKVVVKVVDPFSGDRKDEEDLEWYFERFLRLPFVEQVRARYAAASVRKYGEALFDCVFGALDRDARQILRDAIERQTLQRIEVIGPADFQALHWEALQHPELQDPFATHVPIVRRPKRPELRIGEFQIHMSASTTLNVLVVVARPGGRNDIAYRTLARPLFEECAERAELPVRIDLLRPPTFANLDRFLSDRKARGVQYHIVHLDMHGAVLTWEQTVAGVFTNRFAYDQAATKARESMGVVCKRFDGKRPLVFFEAENEGTQQGLGGGRREDDVQPTAEAVDAEQLGALFQQYGVTVALIDACQSSKQDAASRVQVDSSMASLLLQKGVRIVVGMAYTVTVDAARLLMCEVYERLLGKDHSHSGVHQTICMGRKALLSQKKRRVFFNEVIELEDWILPQVYGDADFQLDVQEETRKQKIERLQRSTWVYQLAHAPRYGFFGRDLDVLEIERRILRNPRSNVLLLRGMGGVGKTTLLEHLCLWWQQTNLVERVFYFGYDAKAWTRQQILHAIAAKIFALDEFKSVFLPADEDGQQALVSKELRKRRHVIVLDNLESVTLTHLAVPNTLSKVEQQLVHRFVQALMGGQTLVLLGSRGAEEWLQRGTFENNVYELGGLDAEAATSFASKVLEKQGIEQPGSVLQIEDMQHVLKLLGGFPLPMAVVLSELNSSRVRQSAAEVRRAIEQGVQLAASGDGRMENKSENIVACVEYSFGNLAREDRRLLECLAPFTGVLYTPGLVQYGEQLRSQAVLSGVAVERFAGAIEQLKQRGLAADALGGLFVQLQPVFPYLLRTRLSETGREAERAAIDTAFRLHYEEGIAGALRKLLKSKNPNERQVGETMAKMECENLVSAALLGASARVSVIDCVQALALYWTSTQQLKRKLEFVRKVFEVGGGAAAAQQSGQFGLCMWQCRHIEGTALLELADPAGAGLVFEQSLALLECMEDVSSEKAMTHHNLGAVYSDQRQWQQAEEQYRKALEIYVEVNDRYEQADTYHQLGRVAQDQRQWKQAEEQYRKALEIYVEFNDRHRQAGAYHNLGIVAQEQRQWQQAEEHYRKALEIKVEFNDRHSQAVTYHQLGIVTEKQRQWQQAEEHYRKALEIKVDFNDRHSQACTYHQLGMMAGEQRQWQQAEEHYRKALEIKVEFNDRYEQADTYHQLGRVAEKQRQWQQAEEHYRKALEIYVEFKNRYGQADTYYQLGRVAQEQRQWQQAEEHFREALEIKVEFNDRHSQAGAYHQLGRVAEEQRQWQQAEDHYLQAETIYRMHSDAHNREIVLSSLRRLCSSCGDAELVRRVVAAVPDLETGRRGLESVQGLGECVERLAAGSLGTSEAESDMGRRLAELLSAITVRADGRKDDEEEEKEKEREAPEERAHVLSECGRLDEAVAAMDEAIARRPEAPVGYFQRAALHCARSDMRRALADSIEFARGGRPFAAAIRECVSAGRCTFTATQREFVEQFWYECKTCGLVNGKGCCEVCAARCHGGHDLKVFPRVGAFYCDCGARGRPMCCALENEK